MGLCRFRPTAGWTEILKSADQIGPVPGEVMRIQGYPDQPIRLFRAIVAMAFLAVPDAGPVLAAKPFEALHENAVAVADPAHVLLVDVTQAGTRLVAVGEHGVVVYSDDDGRRWKQAAVPVDLTLTTVGFATAQVGWAAGAYGVILHTTDGGLHWQKQLDGIDVNALTLAAAQTFSAADPATPGAAAALRRSGIFQAAGPDKPFLSVHAIDPQHVMVFGAYRMCVASADGGSHWQDCSLDVQDPLSHHLYDSRQIGPSIFLAGEVGTVFRSTDAGRSFAMVKPPTDTTLFGVLDAGGGALLTYGVAGVMFRSADAGHTWTPIPISTDSNITSGHVLSSGQVVLATEAGNLFVSNDKGVSFRPVPGNERMALFGIVQAADGDVVLVGSSGVLVVPLSALS